MGTQDFLKLNKVLQCRKLSHSAENEHSISLYVETNYSLCLYITECYYRSLYMHPYLNTLIRLSAPHLNTCIAYSCVGFRLHILRPCRLVSAAPSATNQNRVLRHPSRHPEHTSRHYVTRELSAPGRPFSALETS